MIHKLSNRFAYLDTLIRKQATGSPKDLAERLGMTERGWYKLRDELINDLHVPLAYDPVRQTYYYTQEGQLLFQFLKKLDNESMEKIEGGRLTGSLLAYAGRQFIPLLNCQFSENV